LPALLSIIGPLLPYLLAGIGALAGFLAIRHSGVKAERDRQEKAQAEVQKKVEANVQKAVTQDAVIDAKVEKQIEDIKAEAAPKPTPPDTFRF